MHITTSIPFFPHSQKNDHVRSMKQSGMLSHFLKYSCLQLPTLPQVLSTENYPIVASNLT